MIHMYRLAMAVSLAIVYGCNIFLFPSMIINSLLLDLNKVKL